MNRSDCTCAIPNKPPEEHGIACPVRLRAYTAPKAVAAICGHDPTGTFPDGRLGCGKPIETCAEVYRCTHCTVPFHRHCASRHFATTLVVVPGDPEPIIDGPFPRRCAICSQTECCCP